jgi:hypothetical protein
VAGFFRKVAGAFVELPEPPKPVSPTFDDTEADDVADLIGQLDGMKSTGAATSDPDAPPPPPTDHDLMGQTADAAFEAAGLVDGPNSANRLLKMIAGLAMFPADQQLAMVRALDAADDSWTEQAVLADARARLLTLRSHQEAVEREHATRLSALAERERSAQAMGDATVAEIDGQIAALRELRQEALTQTANTLAGIDGERRALDGALGQSRTALTDLSVRLSGLVTFFAGQQQRTGGNG